MTQAHATPRTAIFPAAMDSMPKATPMPWILESMGIESDSLSPSAFAWPTTVGVTLPGPPMLSIPVVRAIPRRTDGLWPTIAREVLTVR